MRVAITGASGFVAARLVAHLSNAGHSLLLFGRNADSLAALFPEHACFNYDDFESSITGCDVVLHTAVMIKYVAGTLDEFRAVNVDFTLSLATKAQRAAVPAFIYFTTLSAATPPFRSHYVQSKFEGEQALNSLTDIRVVHLRLPAVYADTFRGRLAMLNHLPRLLRGPAFYLLAALRPTLHITTLSEKLVHLLAKSTDTFENVILVTDGQACNPAFQILKRFIDLSFAVSVILFLWWALLGVWLAVRLTSPGPVIFVQTRIGRFGKPFTCYKFRTMFITTKQAATHEVGRDAITPVGRFLRRTKLDELPQIINIIRNEMSLIGPRPCLESQTALIEARRVRGVLDIKPGISGLAQVQGVDMSDPEKLATLDAEYLARQSIMLDVKIMLATARGKALTDRTKR